MRSTAALLALTVLAPIHARAQDTTVAVPIPAEADLARARSQGNEAAKAVGTRRWFGIGFVSGFVVPPFGVVAVTSAAAAWTVSVPDGARSVAPVQDSVYRAEFDRKYKGKVRARRTLSTFLGGLTGTATFAAVVFAALAMSGME
jgi:hypothetical protein